MKKGTKVHFNLESGNDPLPTYIISGSVKRSGMKFFTLEGDAGGLYLPSRFEIAL
jgi:hypothetical protein